MAKPTRVMESTRYSYGRLALRITALLFSVFVVVAVAVAITLIITQKPVDLNAAFGWSEATTRPSQTTHPSTASPPPTFHSRKKFPSNYRKYPRTELTSVRPSLTLSFQHSWLQDGSALVAPENDEPGRMEGLMIIRSDSNEEVEFLNPVEYAILASATLDTLKFNRDGSLVAISQKPSSHFRHSKAALYDVFRINGLQFERLGHVSPSSEQQEALQEFTWNPHSASNAFAFVSNNTMYYQPGIEKNSVAIALSSKGTENVQYGVTDWLYEEDVFEASTAHWWAPQGKHIAFMKFDDTDIPKQILHKYVPKEPYPEITRISYPKAGTEALPKVKLYIADPSKPNNKSVVPPPLPLSKDVQHYIINNVWLTIDSVDKLLTIWAPRLQNILYFTLCDASTCNKVFEQSFTINNRTMWSFPVDFMHIYSSRKGFFTILPHAHTDGNIYNHLAHVEIKNDVGRVTAYHGDAYDVDALQGYDKDSDTITFTSMGGGIATMRLYSVRDASTTSAVPKCISCELPLCETSSSSVSPTGKRALVTCKAAFKDSRLFLVDIHNPSKAKKLRGRDEVTLEFDPPTITHSTMKLPSGIVAHVGLMMPPRLDPTLKYPLILDTYGGPGSYRNSLETPWDSMLYLCSSEQFIIATADVTGTAHRGWNVKEGMMYKLGQPETIDEIDVVKELLKQHAFIDPSAVTVFGWSYGGFLSTHIAVRDGGQMFRCAIAVAPVADYTLYDSAYTERFMGLPEGNVDGYKKANLVDKMKNLRNVSYLLAHGEHDDNVHYQNSALLSQALQQSDIHYTQLVYANQDHSLLGVRHHLNEEIFRFLKRNCMGENGSK